MTDNPFDAGRDEVLGDALRAALEPGGNAAFAARFRLALAEESPWERLLAWTWPGLVAAAAISGKRCVINSSPRDHRCTPPARQTSCARIPSHFHSMIQSARDPSDSTGSSSGDARKNG